MIFYYDLPATDRRPTGIHDPYTTDPVEARNLAIANLLGIKAEQVEHLMDDDWCREHSRSVAKLLSIRWDYSKPRGF